MAALLVRGLGAMLAALLAAPAVATLDGQFLDMGARMEAEVATTRMRAEGEALIQAAEQRRLQGRHASTYLSYDSPLDGFSHAPIQSWFMAMTPKHSSEDTYFSVLGQSFGYMGLQQIEHRGFGFEGKVIFSLWDRGCQEVMDSSACPEEDRAEVVECGATSICERFGGEGTGAKSAIGFHEWSLEQSYGFMVLAHPESQEKVIYEGYFFAPEMGGWVLLSKLRVKWHARSPWQIRDMYSFVEQWSTRSFSDVRFGRFGPGWVEPANAPGQWHQITQATYTHTTHHTEAQGNLHANVTNFGSQWGMGIGGDLEYIHQQTRLQVLGGQPMPGDLVHFIELRKQGQLPTGCAGGTCTDTLIKHQIAKMFTARFLPITIIAGAGVLVLFAGCVWNALKGCLTANSRNGFGKLHAQGHPHQRLIVA